MTGGFSNDPPVVFPLNDNPTGNDPFGNDDKEDYGGKW
jgi:hypothetical protein